MSSDDAHIAQTANQAFIKHLEETGFFNQFANLEGSLKQIVNEIEAFSLVSNKRQTESENIAAHILAMESILSTLLKKHPITEQELMQEVNAQAAALSENGTPNPTVEAIALDLLKKSQIG